MALIERGRPLAEQAETLARSIPYADWQAQAVAVLAQAVAATGDIDRAEILARSITNPDLQAGR